MLSNYSATLELDIKAREFSSALEKYNLKPIYARLETLFAVVIVSLQALTAFNVLQSYAYHGMLHIAATLFISFFVADFVNGLTHMIIDNTTHYSSIVGPYIAVFHMHHYKPKYTKKHPIIIYFTETGHKFWLFFYMLLLIGLQMFMTLDADLNLGLVAIGILSSIAEVSHYWCHNRPKNNKIILFLQKHRFLLSMSHHRLHHIEDNVNYGFLNGISDPLLNIIARQFYKGYKSRSDMHVAHCAKNNIIAAEGQG